MNFSRRQALQLLAGATPALALPKVFAQSGAQPGINVTPGAFTGTRDSLKSYAIPDWFADAKFGIWSHWSAV